MSRSMMGRMVRALALDLPNASDRDLLARFISRRDPEAFAALVRRHGPMVRSVCRRILRHDHDAEDAFQATFLVLLCKAASIKRKTIVGNWLYGVAYHTAVRARAIAAKRRDREASAALRGEPIVSAQDNAFSDTLALLDEKLNALPDRYRAPIVLCDLRGKTRKEAAEQLGWPEGTVAGRLARGRALLAKRMGKSIGVLSVVFAAEACACVPLPLVESTLCAASLYPMGSAATKVSGSVIALAQGVKNAMFLTKLKTAAVLFLSLAVAGVGTGGLLFGTQAPEALPQRGSPLPPTPDAFQIPGPPTHEQLREKYLKVQADFAKHLSAEELAKRTAELEKIVADAVQREQQANRERKAMEELEKAKASLAKLTKEYSGTEAARMAADAIQAMRAVRAPASGATSLPNLPPPGAPTIFSNNALDKNGTP
jgi:RNA polymerase sigma factor (sigma-70 family)